ncbi:RNA polymerase subunit sigma [Paenibacillus lemnae]|uniref:RNA polymerase subunit sigma n=2 Tax=Paenibacillus lemnae TaxID=1330551 RepID=A0A848MC29_PAELE|nr:RNA polymerase subunit sigma [Paenibacillus lemnae]
MLVTIGCSKSDESADLTFQLNETEQKAYDSLKQQLDDNALQNLDPMSVAKLYVTARYEAEHDIAYFLYTQREDHVAWTKTEDQQIPEKDRGTKEDIAAKFNHIENGHFVETSNYQGHIEYDAEPGETSGFQMIKDESGIWKVSFMPLQ